MVLNRAIGIRHVGVMVSDCSTHRHFHEEKLICVIKARKPAGKMIEVLGSLSLMEAAMRESENQCQWKKFLLFSNILGHTKDI
jgi:hypothetical protein